MNRFLIKVYKWVTIKMMQIFSPRSCPWRATEGCFPCLVWRGHKCRKALSPDPGSERGVHCRSFSSVWKDPSWLAHHWDTHLSYVFASRQDLLSKQPAAHPRDVRADEARWDWSHLCFSLICNFIYCFLLFLVLLGLCCCVVTSLAGQRGLQGTQASAGSAVAVAASRTQAE